MSVLDYRLLFAHNAAAFLHAQCKFLALSICITLFSLTTDPAAANLLERLKGYSIDAQSTMRMEGRDKGRPFEELNTRFMKIYLSQNGRIFDFSKVEAVGARSGKPTGGNSGFKIVRLGEEWLWGNVGQRWDSYSSGLIRTRRYPWGKQIYYIAVSPNLSTCAITEEMRSALPDKRFFLFQWSGHTLSEVVSHETVASSCQIFPRNIFDDSAH
jgi:hypothetical protein